MLKEVIKCSVWFFPFLLRYFLLYAGILTASSVVILCPLRKSIISPWTAILDHDFSFLLMISQKNFYIATKQCRANALHNPPSEPPIHNFYRSEVWRRKNSFDWLIHHNTNYLIRSLFLLCFYWQDTFLHILDDFLVK